MNLKIKFLNIFFTNPKTLALVNKNISQVFKQNPDLLCVASVTYNSNNKPHDDNFYYCFFYSSSMQRNWQKIQEVFKNKIIYKVMAEQSKVNILY